MIIATAIFSPRFRPREAPFRVVVSRCNEGARVVDNDFVDKSISTAIEGCTRVPFRAPQLGDRAVRVVGRRSR